MRAQLVHLSGPARGRTRTYRETNILVGTDPDARARFPLGAGIEPRHAEIAYSPDDCAFFMRALEGRVFVNRREIREIQLTDTDLIELGLGGPRLRFHIYVPRGSVCKPVRDMLADAGAVAQEGGVFAFTLSFARDLLTHATWQLKVFFPLFVLGLVGLAFAAGRLGARKPMREMEEREKAADRLLAHVHDDLARGVCLVHGVYGFVVRGKTPRVFAETDDHERLEIEYTGSGFLAGRDGAVVTNRHVVRPWIADPRVQPLMQLGYEPVFFRFDLVFPGRDPIAADPMPATLHTDDVDVAVLRVDPTAVEGVPELPLSQRKPESLLGHRVFVLGYPTGVVALLGKADPALAAAVRREPTLTQADVIRRLVVANAVRPLITQGVLADVTASSLVYDAGTTSGGSGGPVLDDHGAVLGVNYAILRGFSASNFGVPARFAQELLAH
ncbi:MAG: trypsin-like peptidase domain-containing protein [Planctomycetota bacterium]